MHSGEKTGHSAAPAARAAPARRARDVIVEPLAAWALQLRYEDLPSAVIERAKHLIIDSLGCALGSIGAEPVRVAQEIAGEVAAAGGAPSATMLVTGKRTTVEMAAFTNGVMVRYLDFNDTYAGQGTIHPSDMLAPALAVAQACGSSGQDLLLATVIGYEVICALTDSDLIMHPVGTTLWDQATFGVVSAAALTARLMGLTHEQTVHAISLALVSHMALGQTRSGEVSHWKGAALPNAARNAIFCARLAQKGMTGPVQVFEGARGFFLAAGKSIPPLDLAGPGRPFRIMRTRVKAYPAGYHAQSAIDAALQLRPRIGRVDEIEQVRLETFAAAVRAMGTSDSCWQPETRESADHSLPFAIAMALMHGELSIAQYEQERFRDADVRALLRRIEVRLGDESQKAWPDIPLSVLRVRLRDGSEHAARVSFHVGHFECPMTDAQQEAKFKDLATRCGMRAEQAGALITALRRLETHESLSEILSLCTVH
jgi:2-methylcitrate dehydratase